jgi:tetratricopeptide (TPR) repeat protein
MSALPGSRWLGILLVWALFLSCFCVQAADSEGLAEAMRAYQTAQIRFQEQATNFEAAWGLARACFDLAEYASKNAERSRLAQQGITASQAAINLNSNAAPGHYYLAMNLGQLARTKLLGALRLVGQMEREFKRACELEAAFDHAGPERNLGRLYFEAPVLGSVGDLEKARVHFLKAIKLAPDYPENRLNLAESYLKSGNHAEARAQLKLLEDQLPAARLALSGPAWSTLWADWTNQLAHLKKRAEESKH